MHCRSCGGEVSVTARTLFEGTRKPLRDWFFAIWFVTSQKHGASALGLQRVLALGSYQTAWTWLHKIRRAMVRPGRDRLSGTVEIDETFIGAPEEDVHGRETEDKAIVVVAAEQRGKAIGRIRLQRIADASAESLRAFVAESVTPGALVITDGWLGYSGLESLGYQHRIKNIKRSGMPAHKLLPRVHRIASLLKRWLMGTLQGWCSATSPGLLSGRIHVPIQSAHISFTRVAFLPSDAASRHDDAHPIPRHRATGQIL
jgi:hypothetical protein